MGQMTRGDGTIDLYKFPSSGLVALCEEVTDFVRSGEAERHDVDIDSAEFVHQAGPEQELLIVRFKRKEVGDG